MEASGNGGRRPIAMADKKEKITELRDYGDGRQIVLHTEDNEILKKFRRWKPRPREAFYWYGVPPDWTPVAVDLYFPKTLQDEVREVAGLPPRGRRRRKRRRR